MRVEIHSVTSDRSETIRLSFASSVDPMGGPNASFIDRYEPNAMPRSEIVQFHVHTCIIMSHPWII